MSAPERSDLRTAGDERCLSVLLALFDESSGRFARGRARLHARLCPTCAVDLAGVDPGPLLPAMQLPAPRRRRIAPWVLPVVAALVAWWAQGCVRHSEAPCGGDADCRSAGDVCDEGRCVRPACADGDLRPCVIGDGAGCVGVRRCLDGVFGACEAPIERCDGVDDDCDGRVDEGFPDVGDVCEVGRGACRAVGAMVCTADGLSTVCGAAASAGRAEACDGVDDDCDGRVDELAGGRPCQRGVGACAAAGVEVCDPVEGLVCRADAPEPTVEVCNGVDDDCDGVVDDVAGVGEACRVGAGACAAAGVVACGADGPTCGAVAGHPGLERCGNRVDDDCDGEVDDYASCLAGCGNGRREADEGCDDGGVLDGDGCSADCRVEAGFTCLDGPEDTPVTLDGRVDCAGWAPVDLPAWIGGYAVAYAGGAVAFEGDPPRFSTAYSVRVAGGGPTVVRAGHDDDGRLLAADTADAAVDAALGRLHVLPRGDAFEATFPDTLCADNAGAVDVELRSLDDCRPTCVDDADCLHLGHGCVDGRCLPRAPACGDGERGPGEGCDDGNLTDGDGCDAACAVEPGSVCAPAELAGPIDVVPGSGLVGPRWQILDDGQTVAQRSNGAPTHFATGLPVGARFVTRFSVEVARVDNDFIGWTIGGGATALTAPEAPYLLFSWKRATQSEPGLGLAARGLRVGRVSGPVDHIELWQFAGEALEPIADGRTLGDAQFSGVRPHVVSVVGDSERLRVFVDGALEFDLADAPLGDGRIGLYNFSQEAMFVSRLGPARIDVCAPAP